MKNNNKIKGVSILESLVCLVIIGIGFVAVMQLSAFSIGAMDRSIEKNKINFLSEMVLEDMIGDPDNSSSYGNFNETCSYSNKGGSNLHSKQKDKWRNKLNQKDCNQYYKSKLSSKIEVVGRKELCLEISITDFYYPSDAKDKNKIA